MNLPLTMASADYYEHAAALRDGTVKPEGIDLRIAPNEDYIDRQRKISNREYDICECFSGTYLADMPFKQMGYTAIPIFLARLFRHSCIYIRRDSGIRKPSDLNGKRVALRFWNISAGLWMKGMLAEDHDVDLSSITWVISMPVFVPGWKPPSWLTLEMAPNGATEYDLLASGAVPAGMTAEVWPKDRHSDFTYLFPDYLEREIDYYNRTKCVPIMHTLVVRTSILQQHPWVARSMFDAWQESTRLSRLKFESPPPLHAPSPPYLRGTPSIYEHGLNKTRHEVDRLLTYAYRQGVVPRKYEPEELFPLDMVST